MLLKSFIRVAIIEAAAGGFMTNDLKRFIEAYHEIQKIFPGNVHAHLKEVNVVARGYFGHSIGSGASRKVYKIDDELVLKIAHKATGMRHNRYESNNIMQTTYSDLVPKVYQRSKNYVWIVAEHVTPVETKEALSELFPSIKEAARDVGVILDDHWIQSLLSFYIEYRAQSRTSTKKDYIIDDICNVLDISRLGAEMFIQHVDDKRGRVLSRLLELVARYDIEPIEVDLGNVGIRPDGEVVLLDASIFDD